MNIIDFLEQLGQDAELRYATREQLEAALIKAGIEPALRTALLRKDQRLLEALLDANANVCCMVARPMREDEDDADDADADTDGGKNDKTKDGGAKSERAAGRRVA
jgi:hypothetical protein